jgi:ABC-type polysaccharide/polyol phosphate export permease
MKLFITEAKRSIAAIKHYWLASLTDLIVYLAGFIFLYVFIKGNFSSDSAVASETVSQLVIGYLIWFFISISLSYFANGLYTEMVTGTFEQINLTGTRVFWLMFVRFLVNSIRFAIIILPLALAISVITRIPYNFNTLTLILFLLLEIGTIGIAYLLAGLTIRFKNTGQLAFVLSILLLGPSLMNIGVNTLIEKAAATFIPLIGAQTLIKQTLSGASSSINWTQVAIIAVNSIVYLILGLVVFEICLRNSKKLGILNRY